MELYNILLILLAVEFLVLLLYVRKGVNTIYATKLAILNLNNGLSILVHIARDNQRPGTDNVYEVEDEPEQSQIQEPPEPEPEPEPKRKKYLHYIDHIKQNKLLTPGTWRNSTYQSKVPVGYVVRHKAAGESCYALVVDLLQTNKTDGEESSWQYKLRVLPTKDHRPGATERVMNKKTGKPTIYRRFTDGRSERFQELYLHEAHVEEPFKQVGIDLSKEWS